MKNLLRAFPLFLAALFFSQTGCINSETKAGGSSVIPRTITLMTWNVQNLFDGIDNGFEYNEFLQSAGWSQEKYKGKLHNISGAIGKLNPQPDIIMLQEVESLQILEDLAETMSNGYSWSHFANKPGASLGVGIISRLPLSQTKVHSITINGETTPRPVLETRVQTEEGGFALFVCHWKSKLGGDVTEKVRRASARVILRRIRELREKEPELGFIAAGDLNENYDEFFKQNARIVCALLPDDPYCAQLTGADGANVEKQKDFIVISKNKPPLPVHFPENTIVLFSPWIDELENGTYYYKNEWETIDHFLISGQFFDNAGWEYEKTQIADFQPFASPGGTPISYNIRTGTGLSDHLPLLLTLKLR